MQPNGHVVRITTGRPRWCCTGTGPAPGGAPRPNPYGTRNDSSWWCWSWCPVQGSSTWGGVAGVVGVTGESGSMPNETYAMTAPKRVDPRRPQNGPTPVRSSARACGADRYFFAPSGISSSSRVCSRLIVSVRARPSRSRRSTSSRSAAVASSADLPQTLGPQRRYRDRMSIDPVGPAALPGGEHPSPGRQLRGHVQHSLAVGEKPLGDVPANAVAALHRPDPLR